VLGTFSARDEEKRATMTCRIEERGDLVVVNVTGETSKWEVLDTVHRLHERDPRKDVSDLWILSSESVVPFDAFPELVEGIRRLCTDGRKFARSAIVASGQFQKALMDMYRSEAQSLPYEIGVFTSRAAAEKWLKEK
jgi:hypothetical protein